MTVREVFGKGKDCAAKITHGEERDGAASHLPNVAELHATD
jgi:hypothetical protein